MGFKRQNYFFEDLEKPVGEKPLDDNILALAEGRNREKGVCVRICALFFLKKIDKKIR